MRTPCMTRGSGSLNVTSGCLPAGLPFSPGKMEVTFRTVSGESFKVSVEDSTTVGGLKASVQAERGHAADTLKLVYK
jgi:hypothetical protein